MIPALFASLPLAAALLGVEVATGRSAPGACAARWVRAAAFGLAAVAGGVLLVALPGSEWVMLAAVLPLTTISLVRCTALVPLAGARRVAVVALVVTAGVVVGVQRVPVPLTRAAIVASFVGEAPAEPRPRPERSIRA